VWLRAGRVRLESHDQRAGIEAIMGFKDLSKKNVPPHVDTPAQAAARAEAAADVKAKADARTAAAAQREGTPQQDAAKPGHVAKETKGGPTHT
jgi:hypothetical protein